MAAITTHHLSRLRWRCRRGMRELDELLERYLERALPGATERELDIFAHLLELPDPDLIRLLLVREPATASGAVPAAVNSLGPGLHDVIERIRAAAA